MVAAIEYALLAALIAVSLVAAFAALGSSIGEYFTHISGAVEQSHGTSYQSGN